MDNLWRRGVPHRYNCPILYFSKTSLSVTNANLECKINSWHRLPQYRTIRFIKKIINLKIQINGKIGNDKLLAQTDVAHKIRIYRHQHTSFLCRSSKPFAKIIPLVIEIESVCRNPSENVCRMQRNVCQLLAYGHIVFATRCRKVCRMRVGIVCCQ